MPTDPSGGFLGLAWKIAKDAVPDKTRDIYGDGSARTDYNLYDWSGQQLDDYKDVRKKGSDR